MAGSLLGRRGTAGDVQPTPEHPGPTEILGQVAWLMMQSPAHKHLFMADMEWLVLPPLMLRQFRVFRDRNVPVAYASWAYLTEEAEQRLLSGARKLTPTDWKAGDRLWLVDLAAPFGGVDRILAELRENAFKGQAVKTLMPDADGKGMRVVMLGGGEIPQILPHDQTPL